MSDAMLFADLPEVRAPRGPEHPDVHCCVCGTKDWHRVKVGTYSTADLYPGSNVVALRADDGEPTVAWCMGCDPMLVRGVPERVSAADAEYLSWGPA